MATPGYTSRLVIENPDGGQTPVRPETAITLHGFPEQTSIGFTSPVVYTGDLTISEGARKSLYFFLHFPRPGHVNKRGPWHQRLPPKYLTRKERRTLRRRKWADTRRLMASAVRAAREVIDQCKVTLVFHQDLRDQQM
jgi:hypothetical protein